MEISVQLPIPTGYAMEVDVGGDTRFAVASLAHQIYLIERTYREPPSLNKNRKKIETDATLSIIDIV